MIRNKLGNKDEQQDEQVVYIISYANNNLKFAIHIGTSDLRI